jgi:succinate dehydrogenase / fumarate reductase cytochrome b subunit
LDGPNGHFSSSPFLVVHAGINAMIFFNDGGVTFNTWAHFHGHQPHYQDHGDRALSGLILHVVDGLMLWKQNRAARPTDYAFAKHNANSKWYSRSMGILGTLILLFLIVHLWHFWVKTRHIAGTMEPIRR